MSSEQDTATQGHFAGIPLPRGARLELSVHGSTTEEFERLVAEALTKGLQVKVGKRWVRLEAADDCAMSVFFPHNFPDSVDLVAWMEDKRRSLGIKVPHVEILAGGVS